MLFTTVSWSTVRWLICPALFALFVYVSELFPHYFRSLLPALKSTGKTLQTVLPAYPKTFIEAFELGVLFGQGKTISANDPTRNQKQKTKQGPPDCATIDQIRALLKNHDQQRGLVSRVAGFLSFVNILWITGIVGILITLGPVVFILAQPLAEQCIEAWEQVILPAVIVLHKTGVLEIAGYLLCLMVIVRSGQYEPNTASSVYIGLFGALAATVLMFSYSTSLHLTSRQTYTRDARFLFFSFAAVVFLPLALRTQSTLLGYFTIASVYGALGFSVACYGLCYIVGFDGKDSMERGVICSLVLMIVFAVMHISGIRRRFLKPFVSPVMVLGGVVYFLGLLILSVGWSWQRRYERYLQFNLLMVCSLAIAIFSGSTFSLPSLSNTATTFGALYAMQKIGELNLWRQDGMIIVLAFAFSVTLYAVAQFLHARPNFVVAMFDGRGILRGDFSPPLKLSHIKEAGPRAEPILGVNTPSLGSDEKIN